MLAMELASRRFMELAWPLDGDRENALLGPPSSRRNRLSANSFQKVGLEWS